MCHSHSPRTLIVNHCALSRSVQKLEKGLEGDLGENSWNGLERVKRIGPKPRW